MDKAEVLDYLQSRAEFFKSLSDEIWDHPEIMFHEKISANTLCQALQQEGFEVQRGVAGMDTAFIGRYGQGKPVIGFLGEYDALNGLSQQAGIAEKIELVKGGNGHGCGHNLLGVGALIAAFGLKKYLESTNQSGTVIYFGCPAEEGGSGKTFMAREGCFDEVDCAFAWHPGVMNQIITQSSLANCQVYFRYKGVSSHAAVSPHRGRSALDAVELMNVGVQFLREHIVPEARVHYAITNTGGIAPNVVQAEAEVLYLMRAPSNQILNDLYMRVNRIAQGAALMTDTQLEVEFVKACSNVVPNNTLGKAVYETMKSMEFPTYSEEEMEFIQQIAKTNPASEFAAAQRKLENVPHDCITPQEREEIKAKMEQPVCRFVMPFSPSNAALPFSTDVGDVSWITPTAFFLVTTWPMGTATHSWQAVSAGKSAVAHKGMLFAGQLMTSTAIDLLNQPQIIEDAKVELKQRLADSSYHCPIPADVSPKVPKEE